MTESASTRRAVAVVAEVELRAGTDSRAPGGEVTRALCGHWEHDGACRWPHNSDIDTSKVPARLRTVVAVDDETQDEVFARIDAALRGDDRWSVRTCALTAVEPADAELGARLVASP